jgi:hypothetical protein
MSFTERLPDYPTDLLKKFSPGNLSRLGKSAIQEQNYDALHKIVEVAENGSYLFTELAKKAIDYLDHHAFKIIADHAKTNNPCTDNLETKILNWNLKIVLLIFLMIMKLLLITKM